MSAHDFNEATLRLDEALHCRALVATHTRDAGIGVLDARIRHLENVRAAAGSAARANNPSDED